MSTFPPPLPPRQNAPWLRSVFLGLLVCGVLGAAAYGAFYFIRQQTRQAESLKTFRAEIKSQRDEIKSSDDTVVGSSDRMDKIGKALGTLGDSLQGREKKAVTIFQAVIAELKPSLQSYEDAYKKLTLVGFHSPKGLITKEDIAARRLQVEDFRLANEKLTEAHGDIIKKARSRMIAEGLPETYVGQVINGYERTSHSAQVLEIRAEDRKLCQYMSETLDLFEKQFGKWSYSEEKGLLFQDGKVLAQYQGIQEQIQTVAREQTALQQQVLGK